MFWLISYKVSDVNNWYCYTVLKYKSLHDIGIHWVFYLTEFHIFGAYTTNLDYDLWQVFYHNSASLATCCEVIFVSIKMMHIDNSLTSWRFGQNFRCVISILVICILTISCEIAPGLTDYKPTLVLVMVWCRQRQARRHHLNYWQSSVVSADHNEWRLLWRIHAYMYLQIYSIFFSIKWVWDQISDILYLNILWSQIIFEHIF